MPIPPAAHYIRCPLQPHLLYKHHQLVAHLAGLAGHGGHHRAQLRGVAAPDQSEGSIEVT